jgi:hypothetical protein
MVARNSPAEDSGEEEAMHASFPRRRPKKKLSAYSKARKTPMPS